MLAGVFSLLFVCAENSFAQNRKAVSAAEVTGTFRSYLGKKNDSHNEIRIASVGKGKLMVEFLLTYPYKDADGNLIANTGAAQGEAAISGDTAVYSSTDFGQCKITIKFVKPGQIRVKQSGNDTDCGFGANVNADGNYRKTSGAKPKFESAAK